MWEVWLWHEKRGERVKGVFIGAKGRVGVGSSRERRLFNTIGICSTFLLGHTYYYQQKGINLIPIFFFFFDLLKDF